MGQLASDVGPPSLTSRAGHAPSGSTLPRSSRTPLGDIDACTANWSGSATGSPPAPWGTSCTMPARNLLMDLTDRATSVTFLLQDRDFRFTTAFDAVFAADNIRISPSPPRAPRANAICERMIANAAPRATRQDPDRQRTPPAPDPDDLPPSWQRCATTPHTRPRLWPTSGTREGPCSQRLGSK